MGRLRGRFAVAGLLALAAGAHVGCGEAEDPRGPLRHITGRVEAPAEFDLSDVTILLLRDGAVQWDSGGGTIEPGRGVLKFDLLVRGDETVSLVVAMIPRITRSPGETTEAALDRAGREGRPRSPRTYRVGDYEGSLENVRPGATGVVIRLERIVTSRTTVRALGLDGEPASGLEVELSARGDSLRARTGTDGLAVFEEVPVRPWKVRVAPSQTARPRAASGVAEVVPADQIVDVPLRRSIAIRLRAKGTVPHDAFLMFGDARARVRGSWGWRPEADGSVVLPAEPDWSAVEVWMMRHTRRDETGTQSETLAKFTVPVREGATAEFDLTK